MSGMFVGQQTSADTVYLFKKVTDVQNTTVISVFSEELGEELPIERNVLKRVVRSGSVHRYSAEPTAMVLFPYEVTGRSARLLTPTEIRRNYPLAWDYLARNRQLLESREKGRFRDAEWYRFGRSQNLGMWEQPKLMVPYMITDLAAYWDRRDNYYFINVTTGGYGVTANDHWGGLAYLCGLLNSRLLDFYLKKVSTNFHGGYFAANKQFIEQLPSRVIDSSNPLDRSRHEEMAALVERMLDLSEKKQSAKSMASEVDRVEHEIIRTDAKVNELVYELYGIADEDRKVIENG